MFVDLQNKFRPGAPTGVIGYPSVDRLIEVFSRMKFVRPAEAKFNELLLRRTQSTSRQTCKPPF